MPIVYAYIRRLIILLAYLSRPSMRAGAKVSLRLHPARRRFQPSPSPVVVILAAGDPTYTAVHCQRSCVSDALAAPAQQRSEVISRSEHPRGRSSGCIFSSISWHLFSRRPHNTQSANASDIVSLQNETNKAVSGHIW